MTGKWEVNVNTTGMPQKVATAFAKLDEALLGAEYEFIAYLGSQLVNGTNHAVLAKQTVINGRDTKNIVVVVFNEQPNITELALVSINTVVEGGLPLGGVDINVSYEIPAEMTEAMQGFVGSKIEPFAMLGTQLVNGTNYIAAAVSKSLRNDDAEPIILTANTKQGIVAIGDLLATKQEAALGYAFTWLSNGVGKPLGEWP